MQQTLEKVSKCHINKFFSSSIPRKGFLKTFLSNFGKNSDPQGWQEKITFFLPPFSPISMLFSSKCNKRLKKMSKCHIKKFFEFNSSKRLSKNILAKFWQNFRSTGLVGKNHVFQSFLQLFDFQKGIFSHAKKKMFLVPMNLQKFTQKILRVIS